MNIDGLSTQILLVSLPFESESLTISSAYNLVQGDKHEALQVFLDYCRPRVDQAQFWAFIIGCLGAVIKYDAVRCFIFLTTLCGENYVLFWFRHLLFKKRCYRIQRYYGLKKNFADTFLEMVVGQDEDCNACRAEI